MGSKCVLGPKLCIDDPTVVLLWRGSGSKLDPDRCLSLGSFLLRVLLDLFLGLCALVKDF
jgi:hypothetical protein